MNLALVSAKVWASLALAAFVALCAWQAYSWSYERGAESVQLKWDSVKAEQDVQSAKLVRDAQAVTKALQESTDNERNAKNEQIASLNRKLDVTIAGLRNRPPRPSAGNMPAPPGAGTGCTGAQLYRPDGEFLARESARAEIVRLKLASCEADYARAAAALK